MSRNAKADAALEHVAAYKRVLQKVLDSRPSGMRQRLAEALGKNRSFISQISNPAYPTPIPAQHIEGIFEICHFSPREREQFLAAYSDAHHRRLQLLKGHHRVRRVTLSLPDLGEDRRNKQLETIVTEFAEKIGRVLRDT
jgi:hypothetical protein